MSEPASTARVNEGLFGRDVADPETIEPDPLAVLALWIPPGLALPRPLATLSTIDVDGYPAARSVLVSEFDGERLVVHTDTRSAKSEQLAASPRAALTVVWTDAARQLVVQADVERAPASEEAAAFAARSPYLRLLAVVNDRSTAELPEVARRTRWAEASVRHPDDSLQPPPTWIGWALTPRTITFWRGDSHGPSRRVRYRRDGAAWTAEVLPG